MRKQTTQSNAPEDTVSVVLQTKGYSETIQIKNILNSNGYSASENVGGLSVYEKEREEGFKALIGSMNVCIVDVCFQHTEIDKVLKSEISIECTANQREFVAALETFCDTKEFDSFKQNLKNGYTWTEALQGFVYAMARKECNRE